MNNEKVKYWINEFIKLSISGMLIGTLIALYKYAVSFVLKISKYFYSSNIIYERIIFIILSIILVFVSFKIIKFDGNIQGGGLAQIDMHIKNKVNQIKWFISLPLMFVNSLISYFNGLPLGSEAPSAFLGAMVCMATNKVKQDEPDDIYAGMGGGFAAAFLSPLAGIFYAIEECYDEFTLKKFLRLIFLVPFACLFSYLLNKEKIIEITNLKNLPFADYYSLLFLVLFNILLAIIIVTLIKKIKIFINNHYKNKIISMRFFIISFISIILLNLYPILSGSGIKIIKDLSNNPLIYMVIIYFIVRFIFALFSGNSMATGGMVLPFLCLGAINGYIIYIISNNIFHLPYEYSSLIVLLSMTFFFSLVFVAPFTSLFLTISFAGLNNFKIVIIPAIILFLISFIIIKIFKLKSINSTKVELLRTSRKIK